MSKPMKLFDTYVTVDGVETQIHASYPTNKMVAQMIALTRKWLQFNKKPAPVSDAAYRVVER